MERHHRKRPASAAATPTEITTGKDAKLHGVRMSSRLAKGGKPISSSAVLPLLLAAMTVLFGVYTLVSHQLLASLSSRSLSMTRIFHQSIPDSVSVDTGVVHSVLIPQRPRTIGYYFESAASTSFLGMESMDPNVIRMFHSHAKPDITAEQVEKQVHLKNSHDYRSGLADKLEDGDCKAQYEWQKSSFPTCNLLMEQDTTNLALSHGKDVVRLIAAGFWRDVWRFRNEFSIAVVKTIRYEHDYVPRNYDRHRRDAVAMERLTASAYVMDIYGYCGNSGIFEFADGGSIEDSVFNSDDKWTPKEKLVIAFQVASGMADLHNFGMEGRSAIAHTDVTTSQFVYVQEAGIYKLNDFNRCRFLRWSKKHDKACTYHVGNNPGTFRSPEEYAYEPQTEKVDIYSMGNVYYSILSGKWPFEDVKRDRDAQKMIRKGERPNIDQSMLNSTDAFDQALIESIRMCWIHDPEERASARKIQKFLEGELDRLGVSPT